MQRAVGEERVTFEGEYYRTDKATIYDRPDEPVPIYIAASGPRPRKLAGRVGDGFICTSGKEPELYSETLIPALNEGAEKAGRDPDAIERMIEMKVSYDRDRGPGATRTPATGRRWRSRPRRRMGVEDPIEMERLADACRSSAPRPASSSPTTRRADCPRFSRTSTSASPTWCSTPRVPIRSDFSGSTRRRCCHDCAKPRSQREHGRTVGCANDRRAHGKGMNGG